MRNTMTKKSFAAASGIDLIVGSGLGVGTAHARHPRRDEGGHPSGTKVDKGEPPAGETAEQKAAREAAETEAAKKPAKSDAEKAADKAAKDEKARADALQTQLDELTAKHATEDEKKVAETVKAKVAQAVADNDAKHAVTIKGLRHEIIDGLIAKELAETGRTADEFKTVLATLDKETFLDENGVVKKADVSKWASELAGSASKRPPRTGGSRATSTNRGMGQFIEKD
ncbi:scaffolding protein [Rhodococcus phage Braxoaddie]|nr:scaffolding protein [Rhodococcus phage Braxoaddie]WNM67415.1 scaffolding protein [Rhodococcus phage Polyyuki]